jgi:hypothetical protein
MMAWNITFFMGNYGILKQKDKITTKRLKHGKIHQQI